MGHQELSHNTDENEKNSATLEDSLMVSYETKHSYHTVQQPGSLVFIHFPKGNKSLS